MVAIAAGVGTWFVLSALLAVVVGRGLHRADNPVSRQQSPVSLLEQDSTPSVSNIHALGVLAPGS